MKRIRDIKNTVKGDDLPNIYLLHGDLTDEEINELYHHPRVKICFINTRRRVWKTIIRRKFK